MRSAAPRNAVMSSSDASRSIAWLRASSSAVIASLSFKVVATVTSRSAACSASLAPRAAFVCPLILILPVRRAQSAASRRDDDFQNRSAHLDPVPVRDPVGPGAQFLAFQARRPVTGKAREEKLLPALHHESALAPRDADHGVGLVER